MKLEEMRFEKKNFMGIELDVLVGHPEHDLLFIATQVARASGLKDPTNAVTKIRTRNKSGRHLQDTADCAVFGETLPKGLRKDAVMFSEAETYQMLLRSRCPASEPFRKWVTEEVLPSIRKTGKYNAEDSTNPIALAIMDELKSLRGEIVSLRQELQAKTFSLAAPETPETSPYEGQAMVALCDPAGFNKKTYLELADAILDRPAADKMEPRVVLQMEVELGKKWDEEDGRKLKTHVSKERRKWTLFPKEWLQGQMTRPFYSSTLKAVLTEKIGA